MPAMNAEVWVPAVPMRMGSMNNLAILLYDEGHYAEAEKSYREVLGIYETLDVELRVWGPEHPGTPGFDGQPGCGYRPGGPFCRGGEVGARDTEISTPHLGAGKLGRGALQISARLHLAL